jgi:N-acylglucosamine-6-phosphate 2-epimerase/N-acetylmuramic acid 6-phosphate etherase
MSPTKPGQNFPIPRGALIVSCQAREDNPLHGPSFMAAMARAAVEGGALGIRANGASDIAAIRAVVSRPIVGILKREDAGYPVVITPDFSSAKEVRKAGADLIALDATERPRKGEDIATLIARIRGELQCPVFADVATADEGRRAAALGADCVATTLSGYTADTAALLRLGPDLELVRVLARELDVPIIAEGRFDTPALARAAFEAGAHAVVVGTAITNPREITRKFVGGLHG